MYTIDFKKPMHVHFIGIGGISMSGLAEILLEEGFQISGSDMKASAMTDKLASLGASIMIGQKASNITDDIDLVVYTAAIHPDNPEFCAVKEHGIPMLTRAQLLGQMMDNYKNPIAVSGTHGKTTTTSMLTHVLLAAKKDPTISVGGILDAIGGNIRVGKSDILVTEACEYTNSYHSFNPVISIILNVEEDHLDFFSGIEEIRESFRTFAQKLPKHGLLVVNGDMDCTDFIQEGVAADIVTFGITGKNLTYSAANISYDEQGNGSYDLVENGQITDHINLHVNGIHNIMNSLSVIAVARRLGIDSEDIKKGLLSFTGTKRRFEYKGERNGFTIIDDYAHHPTEIAATLNAAKKYPHNEVWTVFQPHTYTRTMAFLDEFAEALSISDHVIVTDIYAAREKDLGQVHAKDIVERMKKYDVDVTYISSFDDIEKFILKNLKNNDLLITMGAGNVVDIGENLLK
ncbi:MAG TPA: UDP-N-acetylmuramate--L-alanine ligase [Candidatus Fimousia stercorigallinarum]|nr:UDP-N-acetylmuramate--L-alanine ligase [Candidatus Fimousia stercorigallinarum]